MLIKGGVKLVKVRDVNNVDKVKKIIDNMSIEEMNEVDDYCFKAWCLKIGFG